MMADANNVIIYANDAVKKLLKDNEAELKQSLPNFSADNVVGQNVDVFHKNPAHQQGLIGNLRGTHSSSIKVGSIHFQLTLNPLFDHQQQRIGTVVEWLDQTQLITKEGMLDALDRSQAIIEFTPEGIVKTANDNFLQSMGYSLDEIKGKHHSMFVDPDYKASREYSDFWKGLREGKFSAGEIKRFGRGNKELWLQASYNPILDANNKVTAVVKYATEITEQKLKNADYQGQIDAIGKSQAVIEFDMKGTILKANDLFLETMGFSFNEIKGKHHSMFVDPAYRASPEYSHFWEQLNDGVFSTGEFKRVGKGGREIWLQASYNPILDLNGNPFKVVKYATDITARKSAVEEIKSILMKLSEGDLTCRIEKEFGPEFQELRDAINIFVDDLFNTITDIKGAVTTINGASSEIAQGNADLSNRTEQQASSLEETASSMEELTGTVRLNAENANQANGLASQASTIAVEGGGLIEQVVKTMESINDSSQKISDIIGVIDGIAFQTNILALNAAVEAARAGEQGRGFAVVASEVRTLAQRSADAAKDIKALISDSVSKIENGNELVGRSGDTMQEVVTAIKRVNDIMSEIAAASAEQASGIDEVGKAVVQMDEVTQQNAALVEEAAAAAETLRGQAQNLAQRVSAFKLQDGDEEIPVSAPVTNVARMSSAPLKKAVTPQPSRKITNPKVPQGEEDDWESF
nr:methyl-accepting chemotaxis protein [Neptunicella marina]